MLNRICAKQQHANKNIFLKKVDKVSVFLLRVFGHITMHLNAGADGDRNKWFQFVEAEVNP